VVGLAQLHYKPVLPKVLEGLTSDRCEIRSSAARLLSYFGDEQAITSLSEALTDTNYSVRINAAISLAKLGKEAAVPELLNALRHCYPSDKERVGVKTTLKLEYSNIVLQGIHSQDIKNLGDEQALDQWLREKKNLGIRIEVAEVLKNFCTEKVITTLVENLKSVHPFIRWPTAILLGQLGRTEAIPALLEVLEYNDASIKHPLKISLTTLVNNLDCEKIVIGLLELLRRSDLDSSVHWSVVDILVNRKDRLTAKYLPELLTLIQAESGQSAIWAIAAIQANCKFYNHEIYQAHLAAQKADRTKSQNRDRSVIYEVNAEVVQIVENNYGTIHGKQTP